MKTVTIERVLKDTREIEVATGRSLAYLDLGQPNGLPIFFFHGLPGSRIEAIALHESAKTHGFRILAPDRPGFGESDPQTRYRFLDWPSEIVTMADNLGLDTFGVIGVSGGGPFALACAHAIPERLEIVLDIGGSAPKWTDAASRQELSRVDRIFSTLGSYLPALFLRPPFAYMAYRLHRIENGPQFAKLFGDAISEPDRKLIEQDWVGRLLILDARESFRQGTKAVAEESILNYKSWGFALSEISMPVHLFHGTEDKLVPFSFGEFKARSIPRSVFNPIKGQGHFYLLLNSNLLFDYITGH